MRQRVDEGSGSADLAISHPWITSAKEMITLPSLPFQKGPACNSPQQGYCKSEQQGADTMTRCALLPVSQLSAHCSSPDTGARGWAQSPDLIPQSKVPTGSQT